MRAAASIALVSLLAACAHPAVQHASVAQPPSASTSVLGAGPSTSPEGQAIAESLGYHGPQPR